MARAATGARRRTGARRGRPAVGADTVSWVDDGVDENDVTVATGISGGNCACCSPLVVSTSPLCSGVPGAMRFDGQVPSQSRTLDQGEVSLRPEAHADRRVDVGDEAHRAARRPRVDDLAHEPRPADHGHADGHTAGAALVELDRGGEVRGVERDDLRGDRRDAADPRQVVEPLQGAQRLRVAWCDQHLSLQRADLASQLGVLLLRGRPRAPRRPGSCRWGERRRRRRAAPARRRRGRRAWLRRSTRGRGPGSRG